MEFLQYLAPLSEGIGTTLLLTFGGFAIGLVLGLPVAAARASRLRALRWLATSYIEVFRGVPPIAWLFIIYYGLGQLDIRIASLPAGIVGLGLVATAYLAEIYRAGLRAVPRGQFEAARAIGLRESSVYRRVIAPQTIAVVLPPAATFAIGLLKDSAIVSVIGASDITALAFQETQQEFKGLSIFLAAGLLYLALSLPIAGASRWLDARLTRRLTAA